MLRIYVLRPIMDWEPWYDKMFGVVCQANDEQEARKLASAEANAEGSHVWLGQTITTCVELIGDGKPSVIMMEVANA